MSMLRAESEINPMTTSPTPPSRTSKRLRSDQSMSAVSMGLALLIAASNPVLLQLGLQQIAPCRYDLLAVLDPFDLNKVHLMKPQLHRPNLKARFRGPDEDELGLSIR